MRRVSIPKAEGEGEPLLGTPKNVEDDVGGVDTVGEHFGAGRLDRRRCRAGADAAGGPSGLLARVTGAFQRSAVFNRRVHLGNLGKNRG